MHDVEIEQAHASRLSALRNGSAERKRKVIEGGGPVAPDCRFTLGGPKNVPRAIGAAEQRDALAVGRDANPSNGPGTLQKLTRQTLNPDSSVRAAPTAARTR